MTAAVLIGGGGHARVVAAVARKVGGYELIGYTALRSAGAATSLVFLGQDESLQQLVTQEHVQAAFIGIGIVDASHGRQALHERLNALGLALPALLSPHAVVNEDVVVEEGAVVLDGAVINPGTRIGRCSIVNTHATVEHDCSIGAYSHIAPGAVLCGGVTVGARAVIGASVCVIPGRRIADGCVVGAGSTVTGHLLEAGIYVGSPARRVASGG